MPLPPGLRPYPPTATIADWSSDDVFHDSRNGSSRSGQQCRYGILAPVRSPTFGHGRQPIKFLGWRRTLFALGRVDDEFLAIERRTSDRFTKAFDGRSIRINGPAVAIVLPVTA
jgi:hypothetical protein